MKKFLVPTDFSETSKNAARFAAQMLSGKPGTELILYYVYDLFTAGSDGSPLSEDDNDRKIILEQALQNLKTELLEKATVDIFIKAEGGTSLIENIDRYVRHNSVDMVVMGITGATPLEQVFMGSNTLRLVDLGICPVMIIPPDAKYKKFKSVVYCSDFKDVETNTPIGPLKSILDLFKPSLHILNIDVDHYVELTDDYKAERSKMENMLKGYHPDFSFLRLYDFQEAISLFVTDQKIDAIITVPKKHSFLSGVFKTSHTKKLAYHSHVPIIAIHD